MVNVHCNISAMKPVVRLHTPHINAAPIRDSARANPVPNNFAVGSRKPICRKS